MLIAALLINADNIRCHDPASSKKRVIESLSHLLAKNTVNIKADEIFQVLFDRERLGSTGLGRGVAIPHARISGITRTMAAMITLETPVKYEAIDKHPIDIAFALLVPEGEGEHHLDHLALLADLFRNEAICQQIRAATEPEQIFDLLLTLDDA